jgi:hypothetical protein
MRLARSDSIRPHSADRGFYNPDENKCSFYDMKLRWFLLLAFCLDVCEVFLQAVIPPASNGLGVWRRLPLLSALVSRCCSLEPSPNTVRVVFGFFFFCPPQLTGRSALPSYIGAAHTT